MNETAFMTQGEQEELKEELKTYFFKTQIPFLKSHYGYRPGLFHIFLGPTGGGKSTLIKTLLLDVVGNLEGRKALLILTEETIKQFHTSMAEINCFSPKWMNLIIKTEDDIYQGDDFGAYIHELSEIIDKNKISIVFYDNITTSNYYMDKNPDIQSMFAKRVKNKLCQHYDIPFVLVAHTKSEITTNCNKIIGPEDIRGCKSTSNLAEFLYTLQVVDTPSSRHQFIKRHKGRNYNYDSGFFVLGYNKELKFFDRMEQRDFERFKAVFEERQQLFGKMKKYNM